MTQQSRYFETRRQLLGWLETLPEDQLHHWVWKYAVDREAYPYLVPPHGTTPERELVWVFSRSRDLAFRNRLRHAVAELYRLTARFPISAESHATLLALVGGLDVRSVQAEIYSQAWLGGFKGRPLFNESNTVDFHTWILKALFALSPEAGDSEWLARYRSIIERDIRDRRYMLECFRAGYVLLWSAEEAAAHVPALLDPAHVDERDYRGAVGRFLRWLPLDAAREVFLLTLAQVWPNRGFGPFIDSIKQAKFELGRLAEPVRETLAADGSITGSIIDEPPKWFLSRPNTDVPVEVGADNTLWLAIEQAAESLDPEADFMNAPGQDEAIALLRAA